MWCDNPLPHAQQVLERLATPTGSFHPNGRGNASNRASVRARLVVSHSFCVNGSNSGLKITCKSEEFAVFDPPSGQTCAAWARDFVNAAGGYLDNPNDSAACRYCQYSVSGIDTWPRGFVLTPGKVGDEFFLPLNIRYSHRWRDVGIYFCFFGTILYLLKGSWT